MPITPEKLPQILSTHALEPINMRGEKLIFLGGRNARTAKQTDDLGKMICPALTLLCDFFVDAMQPHNTDSADIAARFVQNTTQFTVSNQVAQRTGKTDTARLEQAAQDITRQLNGWMLELWWLKNLYLVVKENGSNTHRVAALAGFALEGRDIHPIAYSMMGQKGRLPLHTSFIKKPLVQKTGQYHGPAYVQVRSPSTQQPGYGNRRGR